MKKRMPENIAIIGATGLIGSHILEICQNTHDIGKITVISRRPIKLSDAYVNLEVIDFSDREQLKSALKGADAVFCAVGTTIDNVDGDEDAFRKVDYHIPADAAECSAEVGVQHFLMVSSVGANMSSNNFYLKTKGEAEAAVANSNVKTLSVFRPSLLLGDRKEFRLGEKFGKMLARPFNFLIPGKYKAIEAADVASAMVNAAFIQEEPRKVYHHDDMIDVAKVRS